LENKGGWPIPTGYLQKPEELLDTQMCKVARVPGGVTVKPGLRKRGKKLCLRPLNWVQPEKDWDRPGSGKYIPPQVNIRLKTTNPYETWGNNSGKGNLAPAKRKVPPRRSGRKREGKHAGSRCRLKGKLSQKGTFSSRGQKNGRTCCKGVDLAGTEESPHRR